MDIYDALADPVRRRIVELLAVDPLAARRVAEAFEEISRPAVSRHLRVLREVGLVRAEAVGRERIYRTDFTVLDEVSSWFATLRLDVGRRLDALETEVYRTRRERADRDIQHDIQHDTRDEGVQSMSRFPIGPTGRVEAGRGESDDVDEGGSAGQRLVLERTFRAPITDVWASLTEPERFARWYGPMEGEPGPGRTIMVTMAPEDEIVALPATIVACDPPIGFVVDFGDPERPWRISVNLGEADGITTMTFVQTLSDDVNTTEVGPGWEFYADRMTAALEGGEMPDWDGDSYQDTLGPHYS